ncbi:MAG: hypothetical protein KGJ31_03280 [Patescibacteria group bacterium]|nr:hypothetical protein [Patescibacteria group bacterium]
MSVAKRTILLGAAALLFTGTFGLTSAAATMNSTGAMPGCPLMGIPALCHMSPLDHAFILQSMLTVVPFSGIFAFLVALLVSLSITTLVPLLWSVRLDFLEPQLRPPTRRDGFVSRHSLQEAFSNGILHSRAF